MAAARIAFRTVHNDLRAGKGVRAIVDIWSSTTYVEDLIQQALRILGTRRYGTYHIVNEGVCSYYEFAREAGSLAGLSREQLDLLIQVIQEAEMAKIRRSAALTRRCAVYSPKNSACRQCETGAPRWRTT
jgi:dTDP-4-dehydrorhamnose reductase